MRRQGGNLGSPRCEEPARRRCGAVVRWSAGTVMGTLAACVAPQGPPVDTDTDVPTHEDTEVETDTDTDTEVETDVDTDVETDTDGATDDTDPSCASTVDVEMAVWDTVRGCWGGTTRPMCADWWSDFAHIGDSGTYCYEMTLMHLAVDGTCFLLPSVCEGGPAGFYYNDPALATTCDADPGCCTEERWQGDLCE